MSIAGPNLGTLPDVKEALLVNGWCDGDRREAVDSVMSPRRLCGLAQ